MQRTWNGGAAAPAVGGRIVDFKFSLAAEPADKNNVVPAKVIRQVFLGSSRDYMVEAQDGTQLRIVTEAEGSIAPGAPVWLRMPPERCRALAG